MIRIKLLLALIALLNLTNANAELRLLNFLGEPIKLTLFVDQEVQLNFEKPLGSIGTPDAIKDKLQTQLIDSRLWIKATKPFKPIRVLVKNSKGKISVFLLSSIPPHTKKTQPYPIKYNVIDEKRQTNKDNNQSHAQANAKNTKNLSYVDLTRFAAQTFYAPKRLIKKIDVVRVPVNTNKPITLFNCSKNLACNGNVSAFPLASWRSSYDNSYVSAILLKNTTNRQIILDPRDLLGNWKSATFHFNRLGRTGSPTDTSVVYLISSSLFEQSL